jgi:non-specific serine/threonine protein kinase
MAHDVFISYSHNDKAIADAICANLENANACCWIAPRDIAPGLDWPTAISNAVAASRIMVLVFSAHSNSSMDVSRELVLASNGNLIIIPFKIDAIEPEPGKQYYLARTHWFEAMNPPSQEQINTLVSYVKSFLSDQEAPALAKPAPQVKTDRHNLPAQLTSFIGRAKEMAEIKQAVAERRLVTLIGPGGTGKTRLSLQTAADLFESFPDGVWFIELAPLADPALVLKTVTTTLGLREEAGRPLLDILKDYLRAKDVLLILDNCEHLLEAAARVTATLLSTCPKLHVLASSRESLGIPGEMPYRVPPLSIPDPRALPSVETMAGYEAVQLFVERARTVMPTFRLTDENALAVAQVCQRLDGIPLAIELAAARTNLLKVEQIASRLDDVFRLLTGSSRTALPRQQTLRATIDWSYNLLSEPERILLRRLITFVGGWTLEAAEAVCASAQGDIRVGPAEILDLLNALVNKSLVMVEREQGQEARYLLLETIRQYAREKFSESGEAGSIRDQHLAYFLALAGRAEPEVQGAEQKAWFDRLEAEHDNFRTALEWSLEGGASRAQSGLQMAISLWWFWFMRGHASEGGGWLERLLADSQASTDLASRAKAISRLGWLKIDPAFMEEGLALRRSLGPADRESMAIVFWTMGARAWYLADYARARSFEEQGLQIFRELGHRWGMCETLTWMGMALVKQGDLQQATAVLEESLVLARQARDVNEIAFSLWQLGNTATAKGNYEQATQLLEESLALYKEIKQTQGVIWSISSLGKTALQQGNYQQAVSRYKEALALYWEIGNERLIAEGLEHLAYAALHGQPEQAAKLLGTAEALRESSGGAHYPHERPDYESNLEALHSQLDEVPFADRWAQGRTMTVKQTVAYALE